MKWNIEKFNQKKRMKTQEEIAKLAYAKIIIAVSELKDEIDQEEGEFNISLPSSIVVNECVYEFKSVS